EVPRELNGFVALQDLEREMGDDRSPSLSYDERTRALERLLRADVLLEEDEAKARDLVRRGASFLRVLDRALEAARFQCRTFVDGAAGADSWIHASATITALANLRARLEALDGRIENAVERILDALRLALRLEAGEGSLASHLWAASARRTSYESLVRVARSFPERTELWRAAIVELRNLEPEPRHFQRSARLEHVAL